MLLLFFTFLLFPHLSLWPPLVLRAAIESQYDNARMYVTFYLHSQSLLVSLDKYERKQVTASFPVCDQTGLTYYLCPTISS